MPFQRLSGRLNYYITRCGQEVSELEIKRVGGKMWQRKPPPSRRDPRDPWLSLKTSWWEDAGMRTCPPGSRLSSPGERERHTAMSGGAGEVNMLQFCSVSNSLSHTQTFQIKWEIYFLRTLALVFIRCVFIVSLWFCMYLHMTIQHPQLRWPLLERVGDSLATLAEKQKKF